MVSRRKFLGAMIASGALHSANKVRGFPARDSTPELSMGGGTPSSLLRRREIAQIDRAALVVRHNPVSRKLDPLAPLSVGNGEFAFTGDITGLQTFPEK